MLACNKLAAFLLGHRAWAHGPIRLGPTRVVCVRVWAVRIMPRSIQGYKTLTSVILLLLVVVAEFSFALGRHLALSLEHLVWLCSAVAAMTAVTTMTTTRIEALIGVEVLKVRGRAGPAAIIFAKRVMSRWSGHTCVWWLLSIAAGILGVAEMRRTEIAEGARSPSSSSTSHHGHRVSPPRAHRPTCVHHLPTLHKVILGAFDLCINRSVWCPCLRLGRYVVRARGVDSETPFFFCPSGCRSTG